MLARGPYGVEYIPKPVEPDSHGLGWFVVAVIVIAACSLSWAIYNRLATRLNETAVEESVGLRKDAPSQASDTEVVASGGGERAPDGNRDIGSAKPPASVVGSEALAHRPVAVRHLLMRLEEAEKKRDADLAISTIEQIRALPGLPAADIDDALARRLGTLNLQALFVRKSAQWVTHVTVKSGSSAARIAADSGSTLASLEKLNGGSVERLKVGQKLTVLNHPRFRLVLHRRTRTADLWLNGKFFKRYDLIAPLTGAEGAYETSAPMRAFWLARGASFKPADRSEIEMLLPVGASVLISEM